MDMARFTRALLDGRVFVKASTLRTMTETVGAEAPRYYAAGIAKVLAGSHAGWGHSGFWNTFSYHFPELDVTVAASITQQEAGAVARTLLNRVVSMIPR
jgi:D-alanyl-D-alanine carboxypeptidase